MAKLPNGPAPGNVSWEGDLPAPVTTYASAQANLPMRTRLLVPPSTNRSGAPVVNRVPRRNGQKFFYSHGGIEMPSRLVPRPGAGGVFSSAFQTMLIQLHDWMINGAWFAAGYPRNLGYSWRNGQIDTNATGGPGKGQMQQTPVFTRIQTVRRATVNPPRYNTKAAKS